MAIDRVIVLANQIIGHLLGLNRRQEGQEEDEDDCDADQDELGPTDLLVKVTILPDDVRGLGRLFYAALNASNHNLALLALSFDVTHVVVMRLRLNADEGALRCRDVVKVVICVNFLGDLGIQFVELVPFLVLNVVATRTELVQKP